MGGAVFLIDCVDSGTKLLCVGLKARYGPWPLQAYYVWVSSWRSTTT